MTKQTLLWFSLSAMLWPCAVLVADGDKTTSSDDQPDATVEVKIRDLKLQVPKTWQKQEPRSQLRLGQFALPAAEGDQEPGELVIFSFGGAQIESNIRRWIEQFRPEERKVKISTGNTEVGKYVIAELSGTYKKPDGPPVLGKTVDAPGYRVFAVILLVKDKGVYYLKAAGPDKTIAANTKAIRHSFGAKAEAEKELKLDE